MDFDQTQAIQLSFEDESDEEEKSLSSKTAVSYLKVYKYKDLEEKEYPLYEGENLIGREESCNVCIPTKALSKQHACIEIKGDTHFVYDKKSLNRTRRGKLFLTPDVRYEIKGDEKIIFADVECVYKIYSKTNIDSGSETGSESMLDTNKNNNPVPTLIEDDYNDDSDASSDILQPTQCNQPTQWFPPEKSTLKFDTTSDEESPSVKKKVLLVKDTPANNRKKHLGKSTFVLPESDSDETDDEKLGAPAATLVFSEEGRSSEDTGDTGILNAPTQACIMDSDPDDDVTDDEAGRDIMNAPTQMVAGTLVSESEEEEDNAPTVDVNAATQVYHCGTADSDTDDGGKDKEGPTLKYNMDVETKEAKKTKEPTSKSDLPTTVPYDMDADISGVAETQSFMLDKDEALLSPILSAKSNLTSPEANNNATQSANLSRDDLVKGTKSDALVKGTKSDAFVKGAKSNPLVPQKEETLEEEDDDEPERDMRHLFDMPTLACDMDDNISEDQSTPGQGSESKASTEDAGSTQPLTNDATQLVEDPPKNSKAKSSQDDATQVIADTTQKLETGVDDATQVVEDPSKNFKAKSSQEEATQMIADTTQKIEADATQIVTNNTDLSESEIATIAVDPIAETIAVDPIADTLAIPAETSDQKQNENPANDSEATQPLSETVAVDATIPVGMFEETQKIEGTPNTDVTQKIDSEDATQLCEPDDFTLPMDNAATIPVEEENEKILDEPTQACISPVKKTRKGKRKGAKKSTKVVTIEPPEECEEASDIIIEDATQPYGLSPVKFDNNLQEDDVELIDASPVQKKSQSRSKGKKAAANNTGSKTTKSPKSGKEEIAEEVIDEPTQLYGVSPRTSRQRGRKKVPEEGPPPTKEEEHIEDSDCSGDTLPVDDIEFVPDSELPEDDKPPLIPIPSRSPHKSALASPRKRSPSPTPSPKRVAFVGVKEPSFDKDDEMSPVIDRISTIKQKGKTRGRRSLNLDVEPEEEEKKSSSSSSRSTRVKKSVVAEDKTVDTKSVQSSSRGRGRKSVQVKEETESSGRVSRRSLKPDAAEANVQSVRTPAKINEKDEKITDIKVVTAAVNKPGRKGRRSLKPDAAESDVQPVRTPAKINENVRETTDIKAVTDAVNKPGRKGRVKRGQKAEEVATTDDKLKTKDEEDNVVLEEVVESKITSRSRNRSNKQEEGLKDDLTKPGKGRTLGIEKPSKETIDESSSSTQGKGRTSRKEKLSEEVTAEKSDESSLSTQRRTRRKESQDESVDTTNELAKAPSPSIGRQTVQDHKDVSKPKGKQTKLVGTAESKNTEMKNTDTDVSSSRRSKRTVLDTSSSVETESEPTKPKQGKSVEGKSDTTVGELQNRSRRTTIKESTDDIQTDNSNSSNIKTSQNNSVLIKEPLVNISPVANRSKRKPKIVVETESDKKRFKLSDDSEQSSAESVTDKIDNKPTRGRKGKTSKANITSSQESVQSEISAATSSTSVQQSRTPKRQRGQGDSVVTIDSPSSSKISKQGDAASLLTPSNKKLSRDSVLASPSLRRKSFGIKPKVMFTGVLDEQGEKIVKDLGGSLADSIQECTHLVTDKIRRTVKLLGGICLGIQIVYRQWLEDSKQTGMFLDSSKYLVCDKAAEKQYKFSLGHSLDLASQHTMLDGYKIHVTKSVKPPPETMAEILQCAGAQYMKNLPKKKEDNLVVISCDEDKGICQSAVNNEIDVVSSEFILTGILQQQVNIQSFRLFCDKPVQQQRGRGRKK